MKKRIRIGFLINTIFSDFSTSFIVGLRRFCEKHDCELVIFPVLRGSTSTRFDYQYDANINFIKKQNIDVLVFAAGSFLNYTSIDELNIFFNKIDDIPKISIGVEIPNIPSIVVSSQKAASNIVSHLIKNHKRKKFMLMRANNVSPESLEREQSLKDALSENGFKLEKTKILDGEFIYENAERKLLAYLKKRKNIPDFDAIFCCNDVMALGCVSALKKVGIKVPKEVSVIGYDNIFHADTSVITLTTVDQLTEEQAFRAGRLAYDLANKKKLPLKNIFDAVPVYKESCGCSFERTDAVFDWQKDKNVPQFKKGVEFDLLHYFYSESQEPVSIEKMNSRLEYSFPLFNIDNALIIFYEEPILNLGDGEVTIPNKAKMEFCYSSKLGLKNPKEYFDPTQSIVPASAKKFLPQTRVIFPLSCGNKLFGYMIFSLGKYILPFYQSVFELISREIISGIIIMQEEHESQRLQGKNITLSKYSKKLYELSRKDELTRILNRRGFYEEAQNTISNAINNGKSGLVIYGDMDGLKIINDTFGHDAGDRAIKKEAEILQKVFRSTAVIGRLGGDEFGIVTTNITKTEFAQLKKKINEKCDEFNATGQEKFVLSISVGYTEFNSKKNNLDKLMQTADKLLYAEKNRKKTAKICAQIASSKTSPATF